MKIAIVHSFYRSGPSGENIAVQMQAKALTKAGHEVKVISRSTDDFISRPGYALTSGLSVATGIGPSPLQEINEFEPDIVHVHNLFPNWGDRWVEKLKYPLVATIHNFRPLCAAGTLSLKGSPCELCPTKGSHHAVTHKCYQGSSVRTIPLAIATSHPSKNRIIERADKVIFLNPQAQQTFERLGPVSIRAKAVVQQNFVEDIPLAEKSDYGEGDRPWVFIGRLSPEKGILPLLKAWPRTEPLIVVGSGPQDEAVREAAAGKRIKVLGQVDAKEIPEILSHSKAMVQPSLWLEHSPLTFLEALRAGIPTLAKKGSIVASLVEENKCGEVFDSFDGVADAINEMNTELKPAGERSRALFDSTFNKKVWLIKILENYRSAIEASGKGNLSGT